jgi:uncharacterized protein (TIGR02301 family)
MNPIGALRRRLLPAIALLAAHSVPAFAQEAEPETAAPPYEEQLLRLSEILGAVYYLRDLCGGDEGSLWRDQMQALIDAEQPDFDRRLGLADRFNRGYESYRAVYLTCTPAALSAVDRYMQEGARLAGEITARYGK